MRSFRGSAATFDSARMNKCRGVSPQPLLYPDHRAANQLLAGLAKAPAVASVERLNPRAPFEYRKLALPRGRARIPLRKFDRRLHRRATSKSAG